MNVHVDLKREGRSRYGASSASMVAMRGLPPERWGNGLPGKAVPNSRVVNGPAFDPEQAPAGALLVPLIDLEPDQCRWGIGNAKPQLFCGLPKDKAKAGCRLLRHYCAHHGAMAVARVTE